MFLLMTLRVGSINESSIYKRLHEIMNINEAVNASVCCYGNRYMYSHMQINL